MEQASTRRSPARRARCGLLFLAGGARHVEGGGRWTAGCVRRSNLPSVGCLCGLDETARESALPSCEESQIRTTRNPTGVHTAGRLRRPPPRTRTRPHPLPKHPRRHAPRAPVVQIGGRRDEAERAADVYGVAAGGAAGTPNELKGAFALAWFVQLARYVTYKDLTFSAVRSPVSGLKPDS